MEQNFLYEAFPVRGNTDEELDRIRDGQGIRKRP